MKRDFHAEETYAKALLVSISAMFGKAFVDKGLPLVSPTIIKVGVVRNADADEAADVDGAVLAFLAQFRELARENKTLRWRNQPHWLIEHSSQHDTLWLRARVEVYE